MVDISLRSAPNGNIDNDTFSTYSLDSKKFTKSKQGKDSAMKKVLFVVKDMGGASGVLPIYQQMQDEFDCVLLTEGKATVRARQFGIEPDYVFSEDIDEAFQTCRVESVLDEVRPDMVVTGIGNPINLEYTFAITACQRGKPVVVFEDFPGNHWRMEGVKPDLLLAIDGFARDLAHSRLPGVNVEVVGCPAVFTGEVPETVHYQIDELRKVYGYVGAYSGGNTFDDLKITIGSMEQTNEGCLITCFHPKWVNVVLPDDVPQEWRAMGDTYGEVWEAMVKPLGDRVVHVYGEDGGPARTDHVIPLVDTLFTTFSLTGYTAAYYGVPVVGILTPEAKQSLMRSTGLGVLPPTLWGGLGIITDKAVYPWPPKPDKSDMEQICPFNASLAARLVEQLLTG